MKKLISLFFIATTLSVQASDNSALKAKRTQLIQTFSENLEMLWKLTTDNPPDLFISSLGLSFPESDQTTLKMKSSILYLAAATALYETREQLNQEIECKNAFDKYKPEVLKWYTKEGADKNCPPSEDVVTNGVCVGKTLLCKSKIQEFEPYYEKTMLVNQKYTKNKFTMDDIWNVSAMNTSYWLSNILTNIKLDCIMGTGPQKALADLTNACKRFVELEKRDRIQAVGPETKIQKIVKSENGVVMTEYAPPVCIYSVPQPFAPLYASSHGLNVAGRYCFEGEILGIWNAKNEILLINSRTRAFYWLQMADYYFEAIKKNTIVDSPFEIEKWNGPVKRWTIEEKSFSDLFKTSFATKNYLNPLGLEFSDVLLLGDAYNANRPLSNSEKLVFKKFADKLNANRDRALNLKSDVQNLLIKGKFPFGFDQEHF